VKGANGNIGGWAKAHTTPGQHRADVKEVRQYLEGNPKATIRDVEMCCNMGHKHARGCMREVKCQK
jgi:hypothetical protein